jgi:hypothetical protein
MFLIIYVRVKISDPAGSKEARASHFGLPEFVPSAESADAIGISSVLVSLDLAIHRL